jgi:hypothetical protein
MTVFATAYVGEPESCRADDLGVPGSRPLCATWWRRTGRDLMFRRTWTVMVGGRKVSVVAGTRSRRELRRPAHHCGADSGVGG